MLIAYAQRVQLKRSWDAICIDIALPISAVRNRYDLASTWAEIARTFYSVIIENSFWFRKSIFFILVLLV